MGNMGIYLLALLSILTRLSDSIQHDSTVVNVCQKTVTYKKVLTDSCGSALTYFKDDYLIDKIASNLVQYTDKDINLLIYDWFLNPKRSPTCHYFKMLDKQEDQCCEGWQGDSCQIPNCSPPCSENGKCVTPNNCKCKDGFVGPSCDDVVSDLTPAAKYCYLEATCAGAKPDGVPHVVSKDDCCNRFGGLGWGISDGSECTPCSESTEIIDMTNFNPEAAIVIKNSGNLPFRTCMGTGPNTYRTFDGLEFSFAGRCSYTLFNDGIRTVTLKTINCYLYTQCQKKLTFNLNGKVEISVQGGDIVDNGVLVQVNDSNGYASQTSAVHIKKKKVPTATLR